MAYQQHCRCECRSDLRNPNPTPPCPTAASLQHFGKWKKALGKSILFVPIFFTILSSLFKFSLIFVDYRNGIVGHWIFISVMATLMQVLQFRILHNQASPFKELINLRIFILNLGVIINVAVVLFKLVITEYQFLLIVVLKIIIIKNSFN